MPDALYTFTVTCPASTTAANAAEVLLPTEVQRLVQVQFVIPDGHAGLTGIAVGYGHSPIHPDNTGGFVSGNAETVVFDTKGDPDGVQWSAFVMNLDLQSHSWQVRLLMNDIPTQTTTTLPTALPPAAIYAAA